MLASSVHLAQRRVRARVARAEEREQQPDAAVLARDLHGETGVRREARPVPVRGRRAAARRDVAVERRRAAVVVVVARREVEDARGARDGLALAVAVALVLAEQRLDDVGRQRLRERTRVAQRTSASHRLPL